jgi:hypothetical protein
MTTKAEAERPRQQSAKLDAQFRAVGPAAIVAALICAPKKNKPGLSLSPKAA